MQTKLIKYFSKFTELSDEEKKALTASMDIKEIKKGNYLVKAGQRNIDSYFILSGLIRQYKVKNGDEITMDFYTEDQWIIHFTGFEENPVSENNLICEETSFVVVGNERKAQELFQQFPRLETISRMVMETVFAEKQKLLNSYLTETPEQRYLTLFRDRPDLLQRVPQYQIASYIGVKPESLSRIRKRLSFTD